MCGEWTRNFGYTPLDVLLFVTNFGYDVFYLIDDRGIRKIDRRVSCCDSGGSGCIRGAARSIRTAALQRNGDVRRLGGVQWRLG